MWYVFNNNLYMRENVRFLIVMAYTVVKLPFSLRMIKAAFYAIDEELEDAARNLGASSLVTFLRVKLPIVRPSVLAVCALYFNALFTEYDMSATFYSSYGKSYAMVIQNMCAEEGRDGYNVNASGRRCASTVFIMVISGLILYLVYGVGARDLGERIERREKRRKRIEAFKAKFTGKKKLRKKPLHEENGMTFRKRRVMPLFLPGRRCSAAPAASESLCFLRKTQRTVQTCITRKRYPLPWGASCFLRMRWG